MVDRVGNSNYDEIIRKEALNLLFLLSLLNSLVNLKYMTYPRIGIGNSASERYGIPSK